MKLSNLFIFYKKHETNKRVIIFAQSYIEAKETLFALNNYADIEYDINEYRLQMVDLEKLYKELHLDESYTGYPYILSEKNYENLSNFIENKTFSQMHNTKVLTKNLAESLGENNVFTTKEYIKELQDYANKKESLRQEIESMFKRIGDVWYIPVYMYNSAIKLTEYYIYGRSRYDVIELYNELVDNKTICCCGFCTPNLLIDNYPNYNKEDIDRYIKFRNYIKDNNITKLPFMTK